jgi:DNA-binding NtrC family response regulator
MQTTKTDRQGHSVPSAAPTLRLLFSGLEGVIEAPPRLLSPGDLAIGRDLGGELGIGLPADERASRLHARVQVSAGTANSLEPYAVHITDERSKNGTYVNGFRITTASLADGDLVRIGDTLLLLRYEPSRQVDAPIKTLVGYAPLMRLMRSSLREAASVAVPILLLGESGTGKELAARAIHDLRQMSGRSGPFIAFNCAAIPETLAESQMFGHVAGAFSDARTPQKGFFRAAQGGTLFLDEIGELSPSLQAKLLRAIEEKEVIPVGATRPIPFDVRLIAATHRNLQELAAVGQFRGDLYARLSALPIELPPLRCRREDILPLLAFHWGGPLPRLTARLAEALLLDPWSYNVRGLINVAVHLKLRAGETMILDLPHLSGRRLPSGENATHSLVAAPASPTAHAIFRAPAPTRSPLPSPLKEPPIAREVLERLMAENHGVIARVAELVGRSRRQVRRWLEHYNLAPKRPKDPHNH